MKGERVLIENMWYTILDTVISYRPDVKAAVTFYLAIDEKDKVGLILPESIEVWEKPLSKL